MKLTYSTQLLLLPLFILLYACGPTDSVTVINEEPRTVSDSDSRSEADRPDDNSFVQLNIGVVDPITNLDPLFADNLSTQRAISLIYERLYSLNRQAEPVPSIVKDYSVSEDGRQYEFEINRDLFYQDNDVFNAGVGRRIHADDIRWAFERTAKVNVPPTAAQLLMNISGFENYFNEQREIYDPAKRVLEGISGIQVVDAGTIRINLKRSDSDFLKKLASPLLSIYPREAVLNNESGLNDNPVGTGPYILNSREDGKIILSQNSSPRFTDRGLSYPVDRIDLAYFTDETEMFQQFARQSIDWIPELGPQSIAQLTDEDQNLRGSYRNQYLLTKNTANRITLVYLNKKSEEQFEFAQQKLRQVNREQFSSPGTLTFHSTVSNGEADTTGTAEVSGIYIAYTDNPFARLLFSDLNSTVFEPDLSLSYVDIRVPTPETAFYSRSSDSYHFSFLNSNNLAGYWLSAESEIIGVYHNYIEGIEPSFVPWHLPVQSVSVDNSQRDAS